MTNGRGAGMASFMTKKKKYKFHVDVCLEELLEVPFVSAVLFAKLRLLDGGNFQDHSTREEVRDHKVKWGAKFSFPCKMSANASTGVLERCVLRISVRKECKGGRSFIKLGFVDLNLAQYAGAGLSVKISILEGYDARHRLDNSLLKCSIAMNMLSGDILFKVPSPSAKHKSVSIEDPAIDSRTDELSSGSLGGSIASGSSGFGSLPKKRPPLLSSDLVIGYTLPESNSNSGPDPPVAPNCLDIDEITCETGHSRNSSNTSQLSKASGYSSIHSHSRQSSSGDSGHIRDLKPNRPKMDLSSFNFTRANSFPHRIKIPTTIIQDDAFSTPVGTPMVPNFTPIKSPLPNDTSQYFTPPPTADYLQQMSNVSTSSAEDYRTPNESLNEPQTQISNNNVFFEKLNTNNTNSDNGNRENTVERKMNTVLRSQSDFMIPRKSPQPVQSKSSIPIILGFLTPNFKRKKMSSQSTPKLSPTNSLFKLPSSPNFSRKRNSDNNYNNINNNNNNNNAPKSFPETRTTSLNSLRSGSSWNDGKQLNVPALERGIPHRKLLDGTTGGKLAPLAISPDETPSTTVSSDCSQNLTMRRPSVTTNPSASSLVLSETGSLDRARAAHERRKKTQVQDPDSGVVSVRVENTRVNPDHLIAELLKDTNLEQADDSAETSGLQLFIAKDGTASLGNHEVKSQMSTGAQVFKQVVMDDR